MDSAERARDIVRNYRNAIAYMDSVSRLTYESLREAVRLAGNPVPESELRQQWETAKMTLQGTESLREVYREVWEKGIEIFGQIAVELPRAGAANGESAGSAPARALQPVEQEAGKGVVKMGRIKCQSCGSENNQDGDVFCGDCGTKMVPPQPVPPPPAVVDPLPPVIQAPPGPVMQPPAPAGQPLSPVVPPPAPTPAIVAKAKLVVKSTGRVGHEFLIHQEVVNIGRWDADNGTFPEVDLSQDDAANVVSRRHAKITVNNGEYFLEDVGSVNGTYVNRGPRLMPGSTQKLQNGDEVVMGRTFFTFVIG
jgi:serine/threonine-protein kinase